MNVAPHASPFRRQIVAPEERELMTNTISNLGNDRHQIFGSPLQRLADQSAHVRTRRIEIAQHCNAPIGVRRSKSAEDLLTDQLGRVIGTDGRRRRVFLDWGTALVPVDCRAAAVHDFCTIY